MNRQKSRIWKTALCLMLMLLAAAHAVAAGLNDTASCAEMWVHTSSTTVNVDSVVTDEMQPPYRVLYFMNDGTVYDSSGKFNTYETRSSDTSFGYLVNESYYYKSVTDSHMTKGVLHQGWDGGYSEAFFDRWQNAAVGNGSDFGAALSASADAFVTGEEVTLRADVVSINGLHEPYTPTFHVFAAPNTANIKAKLDSGVPDTLIFKEPGTYYIFTTVVDGRGGRSMFDGVTLTVAQGPETTAEITGFDLVHSRMAEGDVLDWTLTAEGGEGDLQQIVYLYKDGEYLSRHVFDGLEGAIPIEERGSYSLRIRLKDLANNAYSPFYEKNVIQVHPLFDYNVLNEGEENESIELTYYNSYNPEVKLPDSFDGYPVSAVKTSLLNFIDDTITSLTWTPALPVVPGSMANGCRMLETVILPEGVTAIADGTGNPTVGAFEACVSLKNVVLPDTLETIGLDTFSGCTALESITLGKNVKALGDRAFDSCTALKEFGFNEALESIGKYAFQKCAMETIILPQGVTSIDNYAFSQSSVRRLELPDSVTTLGERTFEQMEDSLVYLRWPGGVATVPGSAFNGYAKLETVVLGEGVTMIADGTGNPIVGAFEACVSLKNVDMPDTLEVIGMEAFSGCTALENIALGRGVKTLKDRAFDGCTALGEIAFGESLETIGKSVFQKCALETLVLPQGVASIGDYAFSQSGVRRLELPDSVTTLGERAFSNTKDSLAYLRWSAGVPVVPGSAFNDFDVLETVILPEGVTEIAYQTYGAFQDCDALTTVSLPDTLETIGQNAFRDCEKLPSVALGEKTVSIGQAAFQNCTLLESIELGAELKTIGKYALSNTSLTSLALPDGLTTVEGYAFANSKLEKINFPDSVTTLEKSAFNGLKATLKSVRWPGGVAVVPGSMFYDFDALETVVLPEGVTEIAYSSYGAFQSCGALTTVSLPVTLKTLATNAFYNSALERIYLPCGIASAGKRCFDADAALYCAPDSPTAAAMQAAGLAVIAPPKTLVLPDALRIVEEEGLAHSGAEMVIVPEGCQTLDARAFSGMKNLKYVVLPKSLVSIAQDAFEGTNLLGAVAPQGSYAAQYLTGAGMPFAAQTALE